MTTLSSNLILKKAEIDDVPSIYKLLKSFAEQRLLLEKTEDDLYRQIRGFRVIKSEVSGEIVACAHLDIFTDSLAEVKSLAVNPNYQGQGLGRLLVEDCEQEAKAINIKQVFALTYQVDFFKKMDYSLVDINSLPEKVFKECVICPFYGKCNENALIKNI